MGESRRVIANLTNGVPVHGSALPPAASALANIDAEYLGSLLEMLFDRVEALVLVRTLGTAEEPREGFSLTMRDRQGSRVHAEGSDAEMVLEVALSADGQTRRCSRCETLRPVCRFSGGQDRWCLPCRRELAIVYRQRMRGDFEAKKTVEEQVEEERSAARAERKRQRQAGRAAAACPPRIAPG